jgi:hypothetical protein
MYVITSLIFSLTCKLKGPFSIWHRGFKFLETIRLGPTTKEILTELTTRVMTGSGIAFVMTTQIYSNHSASDMMSAKKVRMELRSCHGVIGH